MFRIFKQICIFYKKIKGAFTPFGNIPHALSRPWAGSHACIPERLGAQKLSFGVQPFIQPFKGKICIANPQAVGEKRFFSSLPSPLSIAASPSRFPSPIVTMTF